MTPEQYRDLLARVDDIHALAVLIAFLLIGYGVVALFAGKQ